MARRCLLKARWPAALFLCVAAAAVSLATAQQAPAGPTYYIAADVVDWNYAPAGVNLCKGELFVGDSAIWTTMGMGSTYKKAQYRQYTNDTFQTLQPKPDSEAHTGILGPVLRAAVGQTLTVVVKNNLAFAINLEPAGVQAVIEGNAANTDGGAALAPAVQPGQMVTYRWTVPASMGPSEMEPTAKLWLYRSTVDPTAHDNAGLVGAMLVSNTPEANTGDVANGQPRDIITVLQILNENASPFYAANLAGRSAAQLGVTDAGLVEGNLKHAVNGYIFCNTPSLEMTQGEKVRWHMASVGSETDMHNLHLHGNTFLNMGHRADHLSMIPGTARSLDFTPANAGVWLMHCHVGDHIGAGMKAMYQVYAASGQPELSTVNSNGVVRTYYIEAEEQEWDYAPRGGDFCTGRLQPWTEEQSVFVTSDTLNPGSKLLKARYVEYTDETFTTQKERSKEDQYLGLLGPIIRAEVGDTVKVVFKNSLRFPATLHPHGVAYLKSSEGSPYFDGTMTVDTEDDAVPAGATYTYTWEVSETSGPGPADPSTIVWMYHSHTNEVADVYAGLVGALIIGRKGALNADANLTAKDVDREVVLFFMVDNEGKSLYADANMQALGFKDFAGWYAVAETAYADNQATQQQLDVQQEQIDKLNAAASQTPATTPTAAANAPAAVAPAKAPATAPATAAGRRLLSEEGEEGYEEPLLKHGINGYLYCNMPLLSFTQGQRVRFHIMALGTEVDMHTPNFVGQSLTMDEQRGAASGLMPGAMHSVDITMANPGLGTVQCRVADHVSAGMRALIQVTESQTVSAEQDAAAGTATSRRYFIAAETVEWDYVPLGLDACSNSSFNADAEVFVATSNVTIGSKYTKAVYRQYTDSTFTQEVVPPATQGILGPTLVTEVGQVLEVVFKNNLDFPANLVLDGGLELLPAGGNAGNYAEQAVQPGGNATYRYYVPESAGPASEDFSTVAYTYTSGVDLVGHPNAGLIGVVVVGAAGTFVNGSKVPSEVDAMVPLLFTILDEAASPYIQQNLQAAGLSVAATYDPTWGESNLKHVVNGFMYCNLRGLTATVGSTVRYILVGMGSEADLHSPVFTGQVLQSRSSAYQTAELMPTVTRVVDVEMAQAGRWPVYCQVHDHYTAGMRATLTVEAQ